MSQCFAGPRNIATSFCCPKCIPHRTTSCPMDLQSGHQKYKKTSRFFVRDVYSKLPSLRDIRESILLDIHRTSFRPPETPIDVHWCTNRHPITTTKYIWNSIRHIAMTYIYASKFRCYKHITYIIHLHVFNVLFYNVKHHIWVKKLSYIDFWYFQVKKLNTLEVTDIWK